MTTTIRFILKQKRNDEKDNDCDGDIDETGSALTIYQDLDGDGYGNPNQNINSCSVIEGYVVTNEDCDDSNIVPRC